MTGVNIIKVGGKVVETPATLASLLDTLAGMSGPVVLVHGGGRSATAMASRLGVETVMVDGRRVTDASMLEVVTMVYGGKVNKAIVAGLQARGVNALGLTGADMNLIVSDQRLPNPVDYGFVGDPREVNTDALLMLLQAGIMPVVAPLTHDGAGNMLNTNADTMAATLACAAAGLAEVTLTFCFEKPGVLANPDDDSSVIARIDRGVYETMKREGTVAGGMIPKLDNAFKALEAGVKRVVITAADNLGGGTVVTL